MSGISGGITVLAGFTAPNENQSIVSTSQKFTVGIGVATKTIYDVSPGKTFYVTYLYVNSASLNWTLRDGSTEILAGADVKSGNVWTYKNAFPIAFTDSVVIDGSAPGIAVDVNWTLIGFEQ